MTRDDVEVLDREVAYQGYFRVDRYRLRHRLFAGGWSTPMQRELFERGHAVAVLPYDPRLDRLVLLEQFRIGALAAADTPWLPEGASSWLLEIVAGIIDDGEVPTEVARREAVEEIGCAVTDLEPVACVLLSPGVLSETIRIYCGRVDASGAGGIHGLMAEHEDIRVFTATPDEAFRWLDDGRIINATAVIALQWFRLHYGSLRERWNGSMAGSGQR